jgi:hypothetical protein
VRANLTAEEIVEAQQQLAREIPSDKEGLWNWEVSWEHLPAKSIDTDIRKWAEKKILDILGVQEDLLVDAIVDHLKAKGAAQELVNNLELVSLTSLVSVMCTRAVTTAANVVELKLMTYRLLTRKPKAWLRNSGGWLSTTASRRSEVSSRGPSTSLLTGPRSAHSQWQVLSMLRPCVLLMRSVFCSWARSGILCIVIVSGPRVWSIIYSELGKGQNVNNYCQMVLVRHFVPVQ